MRTRSLRDRIDRLDPSVGQHRDLAELVQVHSVGGVALRRGGVGDHGNGGRGDDGGKEALQVVHRATLLRRNPTRLNPKWISIPRATIVQAMYGNSQPGFLTTCSTVPRSPGRKLAW